MLRRTKEDVMKDLPPKMIDVVVLDADKIELEQYNNEEQGIGDVTGIEAREKNCKPFSKCLCSERKIFT